jgi:hypothetical protein
MTTQESLLKSLNDLEQLPETPFKKLLPIAKKIQKITFLKSFNEENIKTKISVKTVIDKLNSYVLIDNDIPPIFETKEKYLDRKYEEHMKFLTSKDVMITINDMLNKYLRWNPHNPIITVRKITPRTFMVAWTIVSFPREVLDTNREDAMKDQTYIGEIFRNSFLFINNTKRLLTKQDKETLRKFVKAINIFCNCFNVFLEEDRNKKVNQLTQQWYGMQKNIDMINESDKYPDETKKEECIHIIRESMKKTEKHIIELSPKFNISHLPNMAKVADAIDKKIIGSYKQKLEQNLDEKKYKLIISVFEEIRRAILIFDKKRENELKEHMDIPFLIEQHKNDILKFNDIINLGDYLGSIIFPMSSTEGEKIMTKKWEELKEEIIKFDSINKGISYILIFILDQIEDIKENIMNIQLQLALGIDVFLHEKSPLISYGCGFDKK